MRGKSGHEKSARVDTEPRAFHQCAVGGAVMVGLKEDPVQKDNRQRNADQQHEKGTHKGFLRLKGVMQDKGARFITSSFIPTYA